MNTNKSFSKKMVVAVIAVAVAITSACTKSNDGYTSTVNLPAGHSVTVVQPHNNCSTVACQNSNTNGGIVIK